MSVPVPENQARLILSQCMVNILRPSTEYDAKVTLNERLVGYAIATGVYNGHTLGLQKLTDVTGLPKSTVRNVLAAITTRGWVERRPDKTFAFSQEFEDKASEWFSLDLKYIAILRAADCLRGRDP